MTTTTMARQAYLEDGQLIVTEPFGKVRGDGGLVTELKDKLIPLANEIRDRLLQLQQDAQQSSLLMDTAFELPEADHRLRGVRIRIFDMNRPEAREHLRFDTETACNERSIHAVIVGHVEFTNAQTVYGYIMVFNSRRGLSAQVLLLEENNTATQVLPSQYPIDGTRYRRAMKRVVAVVKQFYGSLLVPGQVRLSNIDTKQIQLYCPATVYNSQQWRPDASHRTAPPRRSSVLHVSGPPSSHHQGASYIGSR